MGDERVRSFVNEAAAELPDQVEDPRQAPGRVEHLRIMTMAQLRRILSRFAPGLRINRRAEAVAVIERVLQSEDLLARLIAGLDPFEHHLLEELKRRGGQASGWELYTETVLRGFRPQSQDDPAVHAYQVSARSAAMHHLSELVQDGLLLSAGPIDIRELYGWDEPEAVVVSADPRLLAAVRLGPVPPARQLELQPGPATEMTSRHPAAVVLELLDLLQLTAGEGGLDVTRTGQLAKPFVRRLLKQRPHLGERLETVLRLLPAMHLVQPPADDTIKQPWSLNVDRIRTYQSLPLQLMYSMLVDSSAWVGDPLVAQTWRNSMFGTAHLQPFWHSMLQCLPALPEQAVAADQAAEALWSDILSPVFTRHGAAWRNRTGPLDAITRMLSDVLPELGLIATGSGAVAAGEAPVPLTAPAQGAAWYAQSRAIIEGRSDQSTETLFRKEAEIEAAGPALLVQPNFEVLAYLDRLTSGSVRALFCASLERLDAHTATFRIDRGSVTRNLEHGTDVEELLRSLARHARDVPANVASAIRDWSSRRERLLIHAAARIIEYPGEKERDAALTGLTGARALAERFVLLDRDAPDPGLTARHDYSLQPGRVLSMDSEGVINSRGPLDLPARMLLRRIASPLPGGAFRIDEARIRAGAYSPAVQQLLKARTTKRVPQELEVLLRTWSGDSPQPALATATLFQHPEADSWALNPGVAKLLGAQLNAGTFVVKAGKEQELQKLLADLGVHYTSGGATEHTMAPPLGEADALQAGLSTRKTRELIETAIEHGHQLELRYAYERRNRTKGKVRTERVVPEELRYEGSMPYLLATTVRGEADRHIRVGFIEAIGVRIVSSDTGE